MAPRSSQQHERARGGAGGSRRRVQRLSITRSLPGNSENWHAIREDLLDHLSEQDTGQQNASLHVEIFLYADRYDEAIDIANCFTDHTVVEPVVDAVWEYRPQWTISACKEQAEPIIEDGQSDRYRHTIQWLETAGKVARAAGELDE